MKLTWARAACSHPALSGVSRAHFGELLAELASAWEAARQSALREARGGERRREEGAGRKPKLVFLDRLLVTLVHLRHQLPHVVLAELFEVDRSTVSAAIRHGASPRRGSVSSTPTPNSASGHLCGDLPDAARPTPKTHLAIASLVSDRSAHRATHRRTSTDLVLVRDTAC
ncbi:transposase family protein [Streptomyces sp. NPDC086766]|uniref:helix-turn-helix domain-containing protein n=1 Tax=Streptomyces sp. NPDC086766 TaxID=3365754 RepID=UPI0037F1F7DC